MAMFTLDHVPLCTLLMIRTPHSLSTSQVDEATAILMACGPMWAVDQYADYNGDVSVMATHEPSGTTFTITWSVGHVDVHHVQADEMHHSGRFGSIKDAAAFLMGRLVLSV